MNESCRTKSKSCHIYEWVISHTWMCHATRRTEACHTYAWVFFWWKVMQWQAGMNEKCRTYENVTSHICIVMWHTCMSLQVTHMNAPYHVTHVNASRHTYSNARHILALFSSFHSSSPSPHSPALSPSQDGHNAAVSCSNFFLISHILCFSVVLCPAISSSRCT